ncbi:Z1 domain-containing protein [Streptomyces sp. CA-278952]|uniref:Z1 domain-containing protein n=1 Tax=Streptomyces sp. CA-278952 TaxID=2980556 RepID=UPI0023689EB5|nr:Z1 domain-containing protein [Streptomyces sp. CA-278952]WDG29701.1 Z1 domain-containing protein [Streptomyces sp. CA-278952]
MSPTPEESEESLAKARRLVLAMFSQDRQPSSEEVQTAVTIIFAMLAGQGEALDRDRLAKEIEAITAVFQEGSSGLTSDQGHEAWLPEAKNDRAWDFWERYRRYLEDVRNLPPLVVRRLEQSTDDVLSQLEDPRREGPWRRAGLVIGQVQSGKTGQYIGLAAKAVDAGYQFVVILAGIHNDLRSQTQLRVDEGLLGFDTQHQQRSNQNGKSRLMGAGRMPGATRLDIASPTNSSEKGDFGRQAANAVNFPLGRFPVVLVVKKHWKILEYLRTWVTEVQGTEDEKGDKIVRDIPLFIIDDEADNASINTKRDPEADPTKTNEAIRALMKSFEKSAYVGYTATPFANIYIDPDAKHTKLGLDLFPDSFIRSLPSPSNYLGPERVFGLKVDNEDDEDVSPLPLVRDVCDAERWVPTKHKSSYEPPDDLPQSLQDALASFVLACAARRARGQTKVHNSMLVHVTRFTDVQKIVCDQVDEHLSLLLDSLRDRHGAAPRRWAELEALWEKDFVPTTDEFPVDEVEPLSWEEVSTQVLPALRKISVRTVNGTSRDALDYYEHRRTGLSVIAIGGQKLSRGLTLEGLTVSYYLRESTTYDGLLQMGRWFGYRPGYEDVCRLYTTPVLQAKYAEVTVATDELRREVEEMAALNLTPRNFGLKVRASSLGLAVTAPSKMRQSTKVLLSYSGEGPETVLFKLAKGTVDRNLKALDDFVRQLDGAAKAAQAGKAEQTKQQEVVGGNVEWRGVTVGPILDFLSRYETDDLAQRVRPRFIAKYIEQCVAFGELPNWTVCLVGKAASTDHKHVAGYEIGPVTRSALKPNVEAEGRYTIRRLLSPPDEYLDLDKDQVEAALEATRKAAALKKKEKVPQSPSGDHLRWHRRPDQALLLIYLVERPASADGPAQPPLVGFKVSFPHSEYQSDTEYVVNNIWKQEGLDNGLDEEDGE